MIAIFIALEMGGLVEYLDNQSLISIDQINGSAERIDFRNALDNSLYP